jgi:hypothetical protein
VTCNDFETEIGMITFDKLGDSIQVVKGIVGDLEVER